jgi:hypothetical protein
MAKNVTVTIPSIVSLEKKMDTIANALKTEGGFLLGDIQKNWTQARGANGLKMKPLSKEYKEEKIASGRDGKRDLLYKGTMRQSFQVATDGKNTVKLFFNDREQNEKAKQNYGRDNNMMELSAKQHKEVTQNVREYLLKRGVI